LNALASASPCDGVVAEASTTIQQENHLQALFFSLEQFDIVPLPSQTKVGCQSRDANDDLHVGSVHIRYAFFHDEESPTQNFILMAR
jgi:hypothetical protein